MLDRWPIRNKLLVGLVLLLVMVGTLAVSSFHGVYAYRSLIKGIGWRANELPLASELSLRVSDLRVGLHGSPRMTEFGLAPGHLSVTAAQMARLEFRENLEGVEKALEKYRKQLEHSHKYGSRIDDSQREWRNVRKIERCLARIHSIDQSDDWYFNKLKLGELSAELEELQKEAGDLPTSLHQSIREFTGDVRLGYRTMIVLTWIASVSAMLMLAIFVHLFYQWVFRPLRILIKGSRKVAAGMFDFKIHIDTHDEMAELADALNDMTSRFRAIRDDLDRQVQERTKQVVRSEQLASVGFLAAGVAHEINNPLASIALCAESLESRVQDLLPAEHDENSIVVNYLKMIQSEAFRCKEITEKLLDFSRMGDTKRTRADLRELVQSVVDMVGHLGKYNEKNLVLLPGEPLFAQVNPQEIKQVVLNLITNGLDSLDPGGTVKIELRQDRDCAEIAFVDNGCGMTHEVLNHLFEPFFTRRRGGQGTGLGLSISYRIVVDHDGHIEASSEGPGRGAQFILRLPLASDEKEKIHRYQAA